MSVSQIALDKELSTDVEENFGTIVIRVVVLTNRPDVDAASSDDEILDLEPDEVVEDGGSKKPIDSYLESPKRGKYCCVFLVNGQRQHAWDNTFIVRDLELKYLRNRMIVVIDIDGLHPEAIAKLMQGSRHQFYEGEVYSAISRRVLATLKGDPDLIRLEEEAEEEISSLKTGDEVVKAALDQLIDSHHDASSRAAHGHAQSGAAAREESVGGSLTQTVRLVVEGDDTVGEAADGPILVLSPDLAVLRLKPGEQRELALELQPAGGEPLEKIQVTTNPPIPELSISLQKGEQAATFSMCFDEPDEFDEDQYPIHATLKAVAVVHGRQEPRIVERPLVITPSRKVGERPSRPPPQLVDEPTFLRVTSRRPLQMTAGGPDLHVKLRWDGRDELVNAAPARWTFAALCTSGHDIGQPFFTAPENGRFEALLRVPEGIAPGEKITVAVEALHDGHTALRTEMEIDVVAPPSPRRIEAKWSGGAQRSPPYELRYVTRNEWSIQNCWNSEEWTKDDPGAFQPSTASKPLMLLINEDYALFSELIAELTAKKYAESTIRDRKTRYTSHVAYHLWQMHQSSSMLQKGQDKEDAIKPPTDNEMREEIRRVASTLIRLTRLT